MSDQRMPENIIAWMNSKSWGSHHEQWHFERRWDFWHARAQMPDAPAWIAEMNAEAQAKGWQRAALQEGTAGSGEDFLFMHRAMFILLLDNFPEHFHYLRGWHQIPQDPNEPQDPVEVAPSPFEEPKAAAIAAIGANPPTLGNDDEFALFLETNLRPQPGDPLARSADPRTGIHNYLHNRWSVPDSPINLGDPSVNIFNQRFWRLHGWIDHQWWLFRKAKGSDDQHADYRTKLKFYVDMMGATHHPPHHFAAVLALTTPRPTRNLFQFDK